ncbi:MAG TPA: hypothetical protein VK708_12065 [Bryobacteraceae bacterium]|nr:hypothetical protein [Bryobacteraceae bacterium]
MAVLRKIALGLLLAASAGVLLVAAWELWSYRQAANLPLSAPTVSPDDRARILQDRTDLLTRRVGDMELLVLILLGTSGLYAIVFVASSYFSATSFARQADQTINHIQDQIGLAMGDLRELQEETGQRLHEMTATPVEEPAQWETQLAEIVARVTALRGGPLSELARLELIQDENTTACLEVSAGPGASAPLAALYLEFARIYSSSDSARTRFYLERAARLAAPESPLASEIHYQLACRFAASHEFPRAMRELTAAFEHQFKTLDERLASDIEEGGKLYELASTAPFDKAVNDLLLNMSIGIG